MEIKQTLELLVRWIWLIVLGTALGGASAFVASSLAHPVYQATATLLISQAPSSTHSVDNTGLVSTQSLASTYVQLITTRPVLGAAIHRLGLTETSAVLAQAVQVNLINGTQLIKVSVEDGDAQQAAAIANTLPAVFSEHNQAQEAARYADSKLSLQTEIDSVAGQIADLQRQIAALGNPPPVAQQSTRDQLQVTLNQLAQSRTSLLASLDNLKLAEAQSTNNVLVVESAIVPTLPIRPKTAQNTVLAAVVGLFLAAGTAFLVEHFDDSFKTPAQVHALLGLPVIGVVARLAHKEMRDRRIATLEPQSPTTEAFRGLRTNLQYVGVDKSLHRLLVTSAGPGEGKSTVVANLAVVMAQGGYRVAIIDADMRRPSQHKFLDRPIGYGLSEALIEETLRLNGALRPADLENLQLMTSGALPPNPAELLGSQKMTALIQLVGEQVDRLIIDSPPVSAVTDATVLANQVDGVLLVIEAGKTRLAAALQAKEQLNRVGAHLVGVVLNKVPVGRHGSFYGNYSYYNAYQSNADTGRWSKIRAGLGRLLRFRHIRRPAAAPLPAPAREAKIRAKD